jgi:HPr kinase/phosphorylase
VNAKRNNIHATAICIDGHGVLIQGPSGSGKSDLALRLIDRGALLICDDRVVIDTASGVPILMQAANIAGQIEVRGIGIINMHSADKASLRLIVNIGAQPERFPGSMPMSDLCGFSVPTLNLSAFENSAAIKVEIAARSIAEQAIMPVALSQD